MCAPCNRAASATGAGSLRAAENGELSGESQPLGRGEARGGYDAAVGLGHAAASWSSGCCELTVRTVLASVGRVPGEEQVGARCDAVGEGGVHLVRVRVRVTS